MADKIYTLQVQPGIKRDGTEFESREYTAGEWMRFQRGNPRKVGGYRAMNANPIRINRGMLSKAYNGVNYTFTGDSAGINVFQNKTDSGVAQGPYTVAFSGYEQIQVNINSITTDNTLTIIGDVSVTGSGLIQTAGTKDTTGGIVAFDTTAKLDYDYTINSSVYSSVTNLTTVILVPSSGAPSISNTTGTGKIKPNFIMVWRRPQYTTPIFNKGDVYSWNFAANYSPLGNAYQLIAHGPRNLTNIDSTDQTQLFVGNLTPSTNVTFIWSPKGTLNTVASVGASSIVMSGNELLSIVANSTIAFDSVGATQNYTTGTPVYNNVSDTTTIPVTPNIASTVAVNTLVYLKSGSQFPTWTVQGLRDTKGTNPTGAPIAADGGIVVLYPFIFAYGSNGYIANNHVNSLNALDTATDAVYNQNNFFDWNGPTANQVNVASGKILKGLPVRGGTSSPSGLFWATNALIRVSFTGQAPLYWSNDLISTDCSLMAPNAVVEQDGVYYWMGSDRFYLYNGTVQVLPNDKNFNYVFDNINYSAREKAWALSVKKYNEIWFFYPRGTSTECNDVVIYNTKDKLWYDLGQASGCRRSCGYPSELFPYPTMAGWDFETFTGSGFKIQTVVNPTTFEISGGPSFESTNYPPGDISSNLPGTYMTAVAGTPGNRILSSIYSKVSNKTTIVFANPFLPALNAGDYLYQIVGGYNIWQHEYGVNKVLFTSTTSIKSAFETCDISFVGGDPSQDAAVGTNRRMKIFRVEQDFLQKGQMSLQFLTKAYASQDEYYSKIYTFEDKTPKVDVREEFREGRLRFESDAINGDYQMGRIMIIAEPGDERA